MFVRFVCPISRPPLLSLPNIPVYERSSVYNDREREKMHFAGNTLPWAFSFNYRPGFSIIFLNHHHLLLPEPCRQITVPNFHQTHCQKMNIFPSIPTFSSFFLGFPPFSFFRATSPCMCALVCSTQNRISKIVVPKLFHPTVCKVCSRFSTIRRMLYRIALPPSSPLQYAEVSWLIYVLSHAC